MVGFIIAKYISTYCTLQKLASKVVLHWQRGCCTVRRCLNPVKSSKSWAYDTWGLLATCTSQQKMTDGWLHYDTAQGIYYHMPNIIRMYIVSLLCDGNVTSSLNINDSVLWHMEVIRTCIFCRSLKAIMCLAYIYKTTVSLAGCVILPW